MNVYQIPVGQMQNYTYILQDEDTDTAVIIDPSWDLDQLESIIQKNNLNVIYIINTHHHFDHTIGNEGIIKHTNAKIVQHKASELYHDISVDGGDTITFGNSNLDVIHTPGHSVDSICLVGDNKIFVGDTIFVGSCGRVDLPGGSANQLYHSIFDTIYRLDDSLVVYPGHNYGSTPTSTIQHEKETNPVMQKRTEQEFVQMMNI